MADNSRAINAAQARRERAVELRLERVQWFTSQVAGTISLTMKQRMQLVVLYLRDKIARNISKPVGKAIVLRRRRSGNIETRKQETVVTQRSKPGEYPRADTTHLMKTLLTDVQDHGGVIEGYVGTPVWYGPLLELKMQRQFLTRTLREELSVVEKILGQPIQTKFDAGAINTPEAGFRSGGI